MSRQKWPGWQLDPDPLDAIPPEPDPPPRKRGTGCAWLAAALVIVLASSIVPTPSEAPEPPSTVGTLRGAPQNVGANGSGTGQRSQTRHLRVGEAASSPATESGAPQPSGSVGTVVYSASATWCAPTPTRCQGWGGNARLAAVNSFRFGDEPYPVRVWRGDMYVDVTVVSFCACRGTLHAIDLSPAAWTVLEPDLGVGRIDVVVEVLVDLPPDPADERMRAEDRGLPATDTR